MAGLLQKWGLRYREYFEGAQKLQIHGRDVFPTKWERKFNSHEEAKAMAKQIAVRWAERCGGSEVYSLDILLYQIRDERNPDIADRRETNGKDRRRGTATRRTEGDE